jgi:hypothetical protein
MCRSIKSYSVSFLWNRWQERNSGNHGENHQNLDSFQFNVRRHVDEWITYLVRKKWSGLLRYVLNGKLLCRFHQTERGCSLP